MAALVHNTARVKDNLSYAKLTQLSCPWQLTC